MSLAILGGTFNPIHNGHLRIAVELAELLEVDQLRMIPCALPPHRETPTVSGEQRMAMLKLAIQNQQRLVADDIELQRTGRASYTVETLRQLRKTLGEQQPLYLCLGMDSLRTLDIWHCWTELLDHCHIVVSARPGNSAPDSGPVADLVERHQTEDLAELKSKPSGCIYFFSSILLPISSTEIRELVSRGRSIDYLTPSAVINYINQHNLYR